MFRRRKYCTFRISRNTFGVGIVTDKGKILADERSIYKPKGGWGLIPKEMAKHHITTANKTIKNALIQSNLTLKDINLIAFSQGPGIPNSLRIGATLARYLSLKYKIPIIAVNHACAHVEIGKLVTKTKDPVVLYVSGGNTQILAYVENRLACFGETEDLPIGNAIDSLARELGIQPPYGPNFDKIAKKGKWIDLSYIVKGMDTSFSGLLTEAVKRFKEGVKIEDVCYSFQETCFAMLTEVTERAMAHTDKKEVLLVGGVAAAPKLQEMMNIMCSEREAKCYVVSGKYSGDNGVMIAWNGILAYKSGQRTSIENSEIKPKWRTDEVNITWL